eukprot:7387420-Prymnesium_polylepis.1
MVSATTDAGAPLATTDARAPLSWWCEDGEYGQCCPTPCVVWSKGWGFFAAASSQQRVQIANYSQKRTTAQARELPYKAHSRVIWLRNVDLDFFVATLLPRLTRPFVLMSSDGDAPITRPQERAQVGLPYMHIRTVKTLLHAPLLRRWYAQNMVLQNESRMYSLPIGLDLHTPYDASWPHTPKARWELFKSLRASSLPREERSVVLWRERFPEPSGIMSVASRKRREPMLLACNGTTLVTVQHAERLSKVETLRAYGEAQFVISPESHGYDCHRTWEVLAMGAIPVVKSTLDRTGQSLFNRQPVLIVDDWHEVCSPGGAVLLHKTLERFKGVRENLDPRDWLQQSTELAPALPSVPLPPSSFCPEPSLSSYLTGNDRNANGRVIAASGPGRLGNRLFQAAAAVVDARSRTQPLAVQESYWNSATVAAYFPCFHSDAHRHANFSER